MKSVDQHLSDILSGLQPLSPLQIQLLDAQGCVLVEDVTAPWPMPAFDNSSMDGYAVHASDVARASAQSPVSLKVIADLAAGTDKVVHVFEGSAARIMTGAPMPAGADAVVPIEWTDEGVKEVAVRQPAQFGEYVRYAGSDVGEGAVVAANGTQLGPTQLAVLAAAGRDRVQVRPRPRVVVLATGNELVPAGTKPGAGQLPDSNSVMLAAAAKDAGALVFPVGIVGDDPRVLMDTLEDQLVRADVVVTSGGVSVGAYDVVKKALMRLGTVEFDKVAMQPGMPQGFGRIGPDSTPIFTLPGNPVSAFVSFEVFVRPALRRMLGREPLERPQVRAELQSSVTSPAGKRQFLRAWLDVSDGRYVVRPIGGPGSHLLAGLSQANALIVVPEETTAVSQGEAVSVMLLERRSS
ncbi:MAG: gephyrin-like molybdotransferase Glp [Actinomycetes bacterium]